jgi:hypothetical protein
MEIPKNASIIWRPSSCHDWFLSPGFHCLLSVLQLNVRCLVGKVPSVASVVLHCTVYSVQEAVSSLSNFLHTARAVCYVRAATVHCSKIFRGFPMMQLKQLINLENFLKNPATSSHP